jgi:tripartite-type tricarboxylate transporter receptor subunit TctC
MARRTVTTGVLLSAGAVLSALFLDASAQVYPAKSVRLIVPYAPGGGADAVARLIQSKFGEYLGQQVVIDNRAGAGSNIGNELAARSAPDGYTLLLGAAAMAINVTLYRSLAYDPVKDFAPITLLATSPNIVVVHPSLPVRSIKELITLAQSAPGRVNYASGGSGTTPHLATELFNVMAKVKLTHVPYKSAGPALIALLSGEVPLSMLSPLAVLPHVQNGRLRALAITSAARSEVLPQLPTVAESGLPGFEASQWYGVLAPAGTPALAITALNAALRKVIQTPEIRKRLVSEGSIPLGASLGEFGDYLRNEIVKWGRVVRVSGARVD